MTRDPITYSQVLAAIILTAIITAVAWELVFGRPLRQERDNALDDARRARNELSETRARRRVRTEPFRTRR